MLFPFTARRNTNLAKDMFTHLFPDNSKVSITNKCQNFSRISASKTAGHNANVMVNTSNASLDRFASSNRTCFMNSCIIKRTWVLLIRLHNSQLMKVYFFGKNATPKENLRNFVLMEIKITLP